MVMTTRGMVLGLVAGLVLVLAAMTHDAAAGERTMADMRAARRAASMSWHGAYAYTPTGRPMALVVPPTASMQSAWSWGVGQTTMMPIDHQFRRAYPGYYDASGSTFQYTPLWPSHTDQFGVYYIRGPW
jgi:hypothetical protein